MCTRVSLVLVLPNSKHHVLSVGSAIAHLDVSSKCLVHRNHSFYYLCYAEYSCPNFPFLY